MEKEKFNAEKIRKVCEQTGFEIMGFIELLDQQSTSIVFYEDGSVTKLPEKDRGKIIGRIRHLTPKSQTKAKLEPEPAMEPKQSKPDVIKIGEPMPLPKCEPEPKSKLKNLEGLPFKERFDDLSKAEVGDYVFANGVISKDPHAAEVLTGIIGWINPNPHAPIGKRAYVITPETIEERWAEDWYEFGCTDLDDGWQNTYTLLDQARKKGKKLPAVEYCANYCKRGVRAGEGFLAALNQLKAINSNAEIINKSLEKIGGDLWRDWIWSSSEATTNGAWVVSPHRNTTWNDKVSNSYFRCVLAI